MQQLLLILLLVISGTAFAQAPPGLIINGQGTATLTWTAPTEYEDGAPLALSDISGYVIFWADHSRFEADGSFHIGCSERQTAPRTNTDCYHNAIDLIDGTAVTEAFTLTLDQDVTIYFAMLTWIRTGGPGDLSVYSLEVTKQFVLSIDNIGPPAEPVIQTIDMMITCTTNMATVTCTFDVQ